MEGSGGRERWMDGRKEGRAESDRRKSRKSRKKEGRQDPPPYLGRTSRWKAWADGRNLI